jgi:hypothetical protein
VNSNDEARTEPTSQRAGNDADQRDPVDMHGYSFTAIIPFDERESGEWEYRVFSIHGVTGAAMLVVCRLLGQNSQNPLESENGKCRVKVQIEWGD